MRCLSVDNGPPLLLTGFGCSLLHPLIFCSSSPLFLQQEACWEVRRALILLVCNLGSLAAASSLRLKRSTHRSLIWFPAVTAIHQLQSYSSPISYPLNHFTTSPQRSPTPPHRMPQEPGHEPQRSNTSDKTTIEEYLRLCSNKPVHSEAYTPACDGTSSPRRKMADGVVTDGTQGNCPPSTPVASQEKTSKGNNSHVAGAGLDNKSSVGSNEEQLEGADGDGKRGVSASAISAVCAFAAGVAVGEWLSSSRYSAR